MATNPINIDERYISPIKLFKKITSNRLTSLTLLLVSIAIISGGLGAALAIVMTSKPLLQKSPTDRDVAVFGASTNDITVATGGLPELTRPVNVLILGTIVLTSDLPNAELPPKGKYLAQVDSTLNGQSDAMLLVRFDPSIKKITALSIPRDSRVDIPGIGMGKINAANYIGGAALSAQTVSQILGNVSIDRYIRVNVQGFGKLVDALGGVDLYVPKRMKYQDDSQHLYINLKPGQQHLDGDKAVQYMRFRQDDLGDIGRVQRQQTLMRALIEQKLNLTTVGRLPEILTVLKENIDTNLSIEELLALAAFAAKTDRQDARMMMVPGRFSAPREFALSYWIIDNRHLMRLMSDHFNLQVKDLSEPDDNSPRYLRVAIQDSISKPEGVQKVTRLLSSAGYSQVFPAEERWSKPLAKTQIIAQQGNRATAEQVRDVLGIGDIVIESTGSLESDVTVRLGRDWLTFQPNQVTKSQLKPTQD